MKFLLGSRVFRVVSLTCRSRWLVLGQAPGRAPAPAWEAKVLASKTQVVYPRYTTRALESGATLLASTHHFGDHVLPHDALLAEMIDVFFMQSPSSWWPEY